MTTPRFARLAPDWQLRGWRDLPWALVNCRTGAVHRLEQLGFYVANACNGRVNFESMAFLPEHRQVLDYLVARKVAEPSHTPSSIDRDQEYRLAPNDHIRTIQWAVTGRCNLHCRHCYIESPSRRFDELSSADIARLVEQFDAANVVSVALTGGEPFLRGDLTDIIQLLVRKRIRIRDIYTNATVVTDRHLDAIAALPCRPIFRVGFDGCGAHDRWRGMRGAEAAVLRAIREIRRRGFVVTVITCVDETNADRLTDTYEAMKGLDIEEWGVGRPQPAGEWKKASTSLSVKRLAELCAPLLERWAADDRPFTIAFEGLFSARGATRNSWLAERRTPSDVYRPTDYTCDVCRTTAYLAPDATLLPCLGYQDSGLEAGMPNLLEMDLADAWHAPSIRALLDITKGDVVARNPSCASCEFLGGCFGGCRASGFAATGDPRGRDASMCEVWRGRYRPQFDALASRLPGGKESESNR